MRHIRYTRKSEDKKSAQQLVLLIVGILSLLFIFFFIGLPVLLKLSSFIAGFKKDTGTTTVNEDQVILEPFLDPLPEATFSATIAVSGSATSGNNIILFVNSSKKSEKLVGKDGVFEFKNVTLDKGTNSIYVIAENGDKKSQPSETFNVVMDNQPPNLAIDSPIEGSTYRRENREIEIRGLTDSGATVSLNDRFVFVNPNGSFSQIYRLSDGENKLEIISVDQAGNIQKTTVTVTYEP